jgi:hypothetical protein
MCTGHFTAVGGDALTPGSTSEAQRPTRTLTRFWSLLNMCSLPSFCSHACPSHLKKWFYKKNLNYYGKVQVISLNCQLNDLITWPPYLLLDSQNWWVFKDYICFHPWNPSKIPRYCKIWSIPESLGQNWYNTTHSSILVLVILTLARKMITSLRKTNLLQNLNGWVGRGPSTHFWNQEK